MSSASSTAGDEVGLIAHEKHLRDYETRHSALSRHSRRKDCVLFLAIAGAVLSVVLNILLAIFLVHGIRRSPFGTFEHGFMTDLEPAKVAIEGVRQTFSGELRRHANGSLYRDTPGPRYFGPPDNDTELNWDRLVYASGIELEGNEAAASGLQGKTWEEPQGGLWRTGLDVFHQLHCLNMVRKSFYPEVFAKDVNMDDPDRLRDMHRDHCLDYIRQALMCNADATPVRLQWDYTAHFLIPKFDQMHTCRNFELLHAWSRARALEKTHDESSRLIKEMKKSGVL